MKRPVAPLTLCRWLLATVIFLSAASPTSVLAEVSSLEDFQNAVIRGGRLIESFRVEGVVCAVQTDRKWIVLQDESAAVLLELPDWDERVRPGDRVSIHGENSTLTRGEFGVQIGTAPVVEVDGLHPPTLRSGRVYLEAGRHPLRVEWFNGPMTCALELEFAGPGMTRQSIPSSALWRWEAGAKKFLPGLDYAAYVGDDWMALPNFQKLIPVTRGVVTNFDVSVRTRPEEAGLVFTGFLETPAAGIYTFYDRSDDGSRVFIGAPPSACVVGMLNHVSVPAAESFTNVLESRKNSAWAAAVGEVNFASRIGDQLELGLLAQGVSIPVTVADGGAAPARDFLHRRVRVTGICQVTTGTHQASAHWIVPGTNGIEMLGSPHSLPSAETLTTAGQVRALQPDEAKKSLPVRVRGVITMVTYWSLVLQDASGGVFVQYAGDDVTNQPRPGELWELTGKTDPGDFSPIILADHGICLGRAALPEPLTPTRDQLMNGSVDANRVEIQGVLTEINASEMELLTRDGRIKILSKYTYPLPALPAELNADRLLDSVVRVRGVFAARWDPATLRVEPGKFFIGNPTLSVDELAPSDPFLVPAKRAADLLLFTSHLGALTRVKVTGQVLFARPREFILRDGEVGLRVQTRESVPLQAGDLAEVVGFPQLGGPSPVLLEANARKTGAAPLPVPAPLSAEALASGVSDTLRVQVEARLLSDETQQGERVFELRSGPNHFLARLNSRDDPGPTLRPGSLLRLSGVYSSVRENRGTGDRDQFELWLNRPSDIVVLAPGPWWTRRHTVAAIGVLSGGLFLALAWATLLRRTIAQRTTQLEKEIAERQLAEQRRLMEQERARVAQDLHDELGAGLAEVGILGSLARNPAIAPDQKDGYLERLTEVSRLLVAELDEIVWAINPKADSTASVSSYLCEYAQEFLRPNSIACRLDVTRASSAQSLNSHQRHQLFLAFKEALTNVTKHAGATEVWIRIRDDHGELCVTVEDNGRGLPANGAVSRGDGLSNMSTRLTQLGGVCELGNRSGGGVRVRFRLRAEGKPVKSETSNNHPPTP